MIAGRLLAGFCGAVSTRVQVTATGPAAGNGGVAGTVAHVHPVAVIAARRLRPAGIVSVTVTVCPTARATGPLLRGVSVKVKLKPGTTGDCETALLIDRSPLLLPVMLTLAVLFAGTGSASGAAIVAVLGIVPVAVTVATMAIVGMLVKFGVNGPGRVHVTTGAANVQVQPTPTAETKVSPVPSVSVTVRIPGASVPGGSPPLKRGVSV